MNWLREKLRAWLGIDEIEKVSDSANAYARSIEKMVLESERVAIDWCGHSKGDTTIIVASQLNDGMVYVIHTAFGSIRELKDFMEMHFPGFDEHRRRGRQRIVYDGPLGSRDDFFRSG